MLLNYRSAKRQANKKGQLDRHQALSDRNPEPGYNSAHRTPHFPGSSASRSPSRTNRYVFGRPDIPVRCQWLRMIALIQREDVSWAGINRLGRGALCGDLFVECCASGSLGIYEVWQVFGGLPFYLEGECDGCGTRCHVQEVR